LNAAEQKAQDAQQQLNEVRQELSKLQNGPGPLPAYEPERCRERVRRRIDEIGRPLYADTRSLLSVTLDVTLFPDAQGLRERLQEINTALARRSNHLRRHEASPFFPAILHLFSSSIFFARANAAYPELHNPQVISEAAKCYWLLIDRGYLDLPRVQRVAHHSAAFLNDKKWEDQTHLAMELVRVVLSSVFKRLNDPSVNETGNIDHHVTELAAAILYLIEQAAADLDTFADLLVATYSPMVDFVRSYPPAASAHVISILRGALPKQQSFWADDASQQIRSVTANFVGAANEYLRRGDVDAEQRRALAEILREELRGSLGNFTSGKLTEFVLSLDQVKASSP
jgi:hypothetical protein